MRVAFISDLHLDINRIGKEELVQIKKRIEDLGIKVLFLLGDTFNSFVGYHAARSILGEGASYSLHSIVGNHEFYSDYHGNNKTPLEFNDYVKLDSLQNDIIECDSHTVVLANAWYDYSFNYHASLVFKKAAMNDPVWAGRSDQSISNYFVKQLRDSLVRAKEIGKPIIVGTHFAPHRELLEWKADRNWNITNAFYGSEVLHQIFKEFGVVEGFYGHTHTRKTLEVEGIKYTNVALGYRHEWTTLHQDTTDYILSKLVIKDL